LRNGISFNEFVDVGRTAFVDVAGKDFGLRGRPTNVSRVSAMTGIGRKEVRRVRELRDMYLEDPRVELSPISDVLHHWYTDPEYVDHGGQPKTLPFGGDETSFVSLVRRCAGDLPAGAVKAELMRCGAVSELEDGKLSAQRRHVVPEGAAEKLVMSLSFGLKALAANIAYNSNPQRINDTWIERLVQSDPLTESTVDNLRPILQQRITRFTEEVDDLFTKADDRTDKSKVQRIGVGIFYYQDQE
jgi:hypothetical protein